MEVIDLPVEHVEAKPLNAEEQAYWEAMADEVCE